MCVKAMLGIRTPSIDSMQNVPAAKCGPAGTSLHLSRNFNDFRFFVCLITIFAVCSQPSIREIRPLPCAFQSSTDLVGIGGPSAEQCLATT